MSPLRIWLKDGYTVEVIRRLADEFVQATGIQVEVTVVDEVAAHDAFVHAPIDERPDLTTVSFWYLPEYARRGYIRPLTDTPVDLSLDTYHPAAVDAMSVDGQAWAVPHTLIAGLFYLRRDFRQADQPLPATPEAALAAVAASAGQSGLDGLVVRGAPEFPSFGTYAGWAWASGVRVLDDPAEAVAAALEPLVDTLRLHGADRASELDYVGAGDRFLTGRALAMFDTTGWGNYVEDPERSQVAGHVDYAVLRGPHAAAQFLYSEGLAVTGWSRRVEEAAALIRWRHSDTILRREAIEQHRFDHPRLDVRRWDEVREHAATRGVERYLAALAEAWDAIDVGYFPRREDFVDRGRAVARAVSEAIAGRTPLVTGLRRAGLR